MAVWKSTLLVAIAAVAVSFDAESVRAETVEELVSLTYPATDANNGLAQAREQIGRGELIEAMATLERLLIYHPGSKEAQLLHASLLCRVDDPEGAGVEFGRLRRKDFRRPQWDEARAPCNAAAPAVPGN